MPPHPEQTGTAPGVSAQTTGHENQTHSLEIPNDPAHIATARLFASAIGRHFGADEEAVEDLRLGVSEAVTCAVQQGDPTKSIRIDVVPGADTLGVEVAWRDGSDVVANEHDDVPAGGGQSGAPVLAEGVPAMGLDLIRGLFEDARIGPRSDGMRAVGFSISLSERSG